MSCECRGTIAIECLRGRRIQRNKLSLLHGVVVRSMRSTNLILMKSKSHFCIKGERTCFALSVDLRLNALAVEGSLISQKLKVGIVVTGVLAAIENTGKYRVKLRIGQNIKDGGAV